VIDRVAALATVSRYERGTNEGDAQFAKFAAAYPVRDAWPLAVIINARNGNVTVLSGDRDIIGQLESTVKTELGS